MMRKYDDEFKRQAVRKVLDGQSVRSVSQELGVNESQIHKWKRAALSNGDGKQSGAGLAETEALKKRVRELELEVEILKKATLIFGRGS
jgi:transposase